MDLYEAREIAARCTHYGMCKTDFLGTGVCAQGIEHKYVAYYPQGRMEIFHALADGIIPVTERLVEIARSCTFCGICDKQCYFVTELRPMKVMAALKKYVDSYLAENRTVEKVAEDPLLSELREIVGHEWATNDPAILVSYTRDLSPGMPRRLSKYIVMPGSSQEITDIINLANKNGVPYVARGNGQILTQIPPLGVAAGVTIDFNRMKKIEIDPENWTATVEPGVTAHELQKEVDKFGMMVNTAEPPACICANINSTGIESLFSHSCGIMSSQLVDLEMATPEGKLFRLNDENAPNFSAFTRPSDGLVHPAGRIVTQATLKMYPMMGDEQAICVPFSDFNEAISMLREIGKRRIGLGASVLSSSFFSMFASPTFESSNELNKFLRDSLGIEYLLMVLGDKYAISAIKQMAEVTVEQAMARVFMLGVSKLCQDEGLELLSHADGEEEPYRVLLDAELLPLWEMVLSPSPDNMAQAVESSMQEFFRELYTRPEMTDLFWLNRFRPLPARMGRAHASIPAGFYSPLDNEIINELCAALRSIGDKYHLDNDLGFIIPIDNGKRARLEWYYYYDQTDGHDKQTVFQARREVEAMAKMLVNKHKGFRLAEWVFNQGFSRQDGFLYT